jgi:tRNA-modifying protein YgfZ
MDTPTTHRAAELSRLGMLEVTGDDARAFLQAQLTSEIARLPPRQARYAGWCSAKGRLLASFLVVPHGESFLLQVARDLAPAVAKRLAMFVLRSKVRISDASDAWVQLGVWGSAAEAQLAGLGMTSPSGELGVSETQIGLAVRIAERRCLLVVPTARRAAIDAQMAVGSEQAWALEEIRAGRALITQATQDQFVPQMLDFELHGAVDFDKGCYPGQEVVARAQYRGQLKRRMVLARVGAQARPGDDVHAADLPGQAAGLVVNAAPAPDGGCELLAVVPIASVAQRSSLRLGSPEGPQLEILALPYAK